jgi:hypothetical protein
MSITKSSIGWKNRPPGWPTSLQLRSPVPLPQVGSSLLNPDDPLCLDSGRSPRPISAARPRRGVYGTCPGGTRTGSCWCPPATRSRSLTSPVARDWYKRSIPKACYFPARVTPGRLNAQLPYNPFLCRSACEQAFPRELLLGLTRDTVVTVR